MIYFHFLISPTFFLFPGALHAPELLKQNDNIITKILNFPSFTTGISF